MSLKADEINIGILIENYKVCGLTPFVGDSASPQGFQAFGYVQKMLRVRNAKHLKQPLGSKKLATFFQT